MSQLLIPGPRNVFRPILPWLNSGTPPAVKGALAQSTLVGSNQKCPLVVPLKQLPCIPSGLGLKVRICRGSLKICTGPMMSGRSQEIIRFAGIVI